MRKATILIVEDDAILAMDLQRMLMRLDYTIAGPLASGEEALALLSGKPVDLVLMDIELAGTMNGIAAAEIILRTTGIPVVFLTGFSQDPLLEQAKIAAPYGYLIKPVPERELSATLEMALHRHMLDRRLKETMAEHKEAEKKNAKLLAENRQLQKSESLGRMAGAIAHHFNNKLGAVIGNLEMALDDLTDDSETVKILTNALQAAHMAAEVSGLMLTYLGQTVGTQTGLDLAEACRQNLPLLQAASTRNLPFKVNLPCPGPMIRANVNQIRQVLTNLITNAREATEQNQGDIELIVRTVSPTDIPEACRYPIDWQPAATNYGCLEVRDTGCGIAEIDIDTLFDPFYSSKSDGRGLGLPVVLGIVKAHGGAVTVVSEVGRGSTFRVFLPQFLEEAPVLTGTARESLPIKRHGKVLLVEDEEILREMALTMLTRLGYQVLPAKDGVEAVEIFTKHANEIDVVLSDLSMPRMNGWETLTALRHIRPDIPVVLASGHDQSKVLAGDHPDLPQVFLHKPYQKAELQIALAKAMGGKDSLV